MLWLRRKPERGYSNPEEFYFYLLTIKKVGGDLEIVGYFSKEKIFCTHAEFKNLTDVVVFPHFKGEGYGKWLVDLRNKLSTVKKKKTGIPETLLSDEGKDLYIKNDFILTIL